MGTTRARVKPVQWAAQAARPAGGGARCQRNRTSVRRLPRSAPAACRRAPCAAGGRRVGAWTGRCPSTAPRCGAAPTKPRDRRHVCASPPAGAVASTSSVRRTSLHCTRRPYATIGTAPRRTCGGVSRPAPSGGEDAAKRAQSRCAWTARYPCDGLDAHGTAPPRQRWAGPAPAARLKPARRARGGTASAPGAAAPAAPRRRGWRRCARGSCRSSHPRC
jgi:hypothetical protein